MGEEETPMKLYRNIGILVVILALLVGVYFYASNQKPKEEPVKDDTVTIFKTEKDNIIEISIKTANSHIVLTKGEDEKEWTLKKPNIPDIQLIHSKIDSLAYDVASITAEQVVEENAQDLSPYGLDQPLSQVDIVLKDGGTKTFYVGDSTPSKTKYYFREEGSNTVYTVYSYKGESLSSQLDEYRDKTIFTLKPEEIIGFTIEGKNREKLVVREKDEKADDQTGALSTWNVVEPIQGSGDNQKIGEMILNQLPNITVEEFVEDNPKDLEKYGLSSPNYRIQFTDKNNKTVTLLLGNEKDDMIYLKLDGKDAVYLVDAENLAFKDIDVFEILEKFAYIVNIDLVDKIVVNGDGKQTTLEIIHKQKDAEQDKEEVEDEYKVDGKQAAEDPFKKMYQEIIGLIVDGKIDDQVKIEGQPEVSYTFYHNNGAPNVTMEYVSIDNRKYAVVKNGKAEFYILKKKVRNMLDELEEFKSDPTKEEE